MSLDFKILSDVQQYINLPGVPAKQWIHHATVVRRGKEYLVFRHAELGSIYMEEIEQHRSTIILNKIEDDTEWADLYYFCEAAGLFNITGEVKVADNSFWENLWPLRQNGKINL